MRKLCIAFVALFVAAGAFFVITQKSAGKSDKFKKSEQAVPNRYIVILNEDSLELSKKDPDSAATELSAEYSGTINKIYRESLKGFAVGMSHDNALRLSDDPRVKYVEEDGYIRTEATQNDASWGLDRIDQRPQPMDGLYNYSFSGTGVHVYVIDSGILTTHPDFQGRAVDSYDAVHDNTPLDQCNGHGTNVAGVIGSTTFGVAKNVTLHSVRVIGCDGYGTVSDVLAGVDWVTRHAVKPAVANMSLGGGYSQTMNDAVASSIASGITYAVAAGNETDDACRHSPASLPSAITVGATTRFDERLYNTNYGACVDVFAPGLSVTTTGVQAAYPVVYVSGTSFSSPYAAGVAALYLEAFPTASPAVVANYISTAATPGVLTNIGNLSPNLLLYSIIDVVPSGTCSGTEFDGNLITAKGSDFQSSSLGFNGGSGVYSGSLTVPKDAQFKLSLERKKGSRWSAVASSSQPAGDQTVTYTGSSGMYRWKIASVSGVGQYVLCAVNP